MSIVHGIWGDDKTGKTSLALTYPKPLLIQEFDIGGFDRAKSRFSAEMNAGLITKKLYIMPFQFGSAEKLKAGQLLKPSKIVVGIKELFYQFLADYLEALDSSSIQTIVIDTGTILWEIVSMGYLQEKQELQLDAYGNLKPNEKSLRAQLGEIEYREPNLRMRGIIYQAKAKGKNLVITHHSREQYGMGLVKGEMVKVATGKRERSGWKALGDGADMIMHTYLKNVDNAIKPVCMIELAGTLPMVGMELTEPTYDRIAGLEKMMRGEA